MQAPQAQGRQPDHDRHRDRQQHPAEDREWERKPQDVGADGRARPAHGDERALGHRDLSQPSDDDDEAHQYQHVHERDVHRQGPEGRERQEGKRQGNGTQHERQSPPHA